MNILIPYFPILGTDSYPDHYQLFTPLQLLTFQGDKYYLTDYSGNKNLETRATYAEYKAWLDAQPPSTGIRILGVTPFRRRFTTAERKAISNTPDFEVQDYWSGILYRSSVDLDDPSIRTMLEYFLDPFEGDPILLTQARVDELLQDGTEYEAA